MRTITKKLAEISKHRYLRFDCKYWITKREFFLTNSVLLRDLFFVISGSVQTSHYTNTATDYPYVRIGDIEYKYGITLDSFIFLDSADDIPKEKIIKKDDLILATIGATVGKIGLANLCAGGTHSNNTVILRAKNSDINTKFYEKLLQTDFYVKYILGIVSQKAQPNLQEYDLKNICLPMVSNQKIKEVLEAIQPIETKINNQRKRLSKIQKTIDDIIASTFCIDRNALYSIDQKKQIKPLLSNFQDNSINLRFSYRWNKALEIQKELVSQVECCKQLGKYIISTQNGWSPTCDENKSSYQVLGVNAVKRNGTISFENVKYSDEFKANFESFVVNDKDFFVTRGNTTDLVAMAAVAYVKEDNHITIFPDLLIRVEFTKDICKEYMAFIFNSFVGRLYFKYSTKGKNQTMVKVSPQELNDFYVPIPSQEEQKRIVDEIQTEIAKQDAINAEIANLRAQIDKIIEDTIQADV